MWEVVVDKDKCSGDEECVDACPAQVYEMVDGKSDPVNMDECLGCETRRAARSTECRFSMPIVRPTCS